MTNYRTAQFWYGQGVRRVVTAREMSLAEIAAMREKLPEDMEIEAFSHGAMCVSYSGRCLLSNFMTGRDANRGECAHPCRWKYALVEEQRPGVYWPVEEDSHGSYIMNSGDLCMIEHIPEMAEAGITSFKIEGRMKSIFYLASVVAQYRKALDEAEVILAGKASGKTDADGAEAVYKENAAGWLKELGKASHRTFTTGFYYGKPDASSHNYETSAYVRDYTFTGLVLAYDPSTGEALVEQRNKMRIGETIEVFGPAGENFSQILREMKDAETKEPLESAPHPQQQLLIRMDSPVSAGSMLRRAK
jgi:putative protease